jgi:hypothetical protein
MTRRKASPLKLAKETLRTLTNDALSRAVGGAAASAVFITLCPGSQSCQSVEKNGCGTLVSQDD